VLVLVVVLEAVLNMLHKMKPRIAIAGPLNLFEVLNSTLKTGLNLPGPPIIASVVKIIYTGMLCCVAEMAGIQIAYSFHRFITALGSLPFICAEF
jgi:hypothetical protein